MLFFNTKEYQDFKKDLETYYNKEHNNLQVVIEDYPVLVLELKNMYIYFQLEHIEVDKIRLTFHKFNSKLIKQSETRITYSDYIEILERVINVIEHNTHKDKRL